MWISLPDVTKEENFYKDWHWEFVGWAYGKYVPHFNTKVGELVKHWYYLTKEGTSKYCEIPLYGSPPEGWVSVYASATDPNITHKSGTNLWEIS